MANSKFKSRFGNLKNVDVRKSESGTEYARFQLETPNFTVYGVTFKEDLIKTLAETEDGEHVWAGGYIDAKKVTSDEGEKTYLTLVAQSIKVGKLEDKAEDAGAADEASEEVVADDLTQLKGVGEAAAQKLNDLGYLTFAQLADTTEDERAVLDEDVPSIKGGLSRYDVFGQAVKMAA